MKCDCCSKRRGLFESFTNLKTNDGVLHICVKCSTLVYIIRDDLKDNDPKLKDHLAELEKRETKDATAFKKWLNTKILNK